MSLFIFIFFSVEVQVDPHLKSLHLTLAYQFDVSQKETLKSLIKSTINPSTPCLWELKLYSREATATNKQVILIDLIAYFIIYNFANKIKVCVYFRFIKLCMHMFHKLLMN